ncbi:hypothetical protein Agub_g15314, partial [Astrephomene gubernaculifera]
MAILNNLCKSIGRGMEASESGALLLGGPFGDERNMFVLKPFTTKAYKQKIKAKVRGEETSISPEYILQQARMTHGRNMLGICTAADLRQRAVPASMIRLQAENYACQVPQPSFSGYSTSSGFGSEHRHDPLDMLGEDSGRRRRRDTTAAFAAAAAPATSSSIAGAATIVPATAAEVASVAAATTEASTGKAFGDACKQQDGQEASGEPLAGSVAGGSSNPGREGSSAGDSSGSDGSSRDTGAVSAAAVDTGLLVLGQEEEGAEAEQQQAAGEEDCRAHAAAIAAAAAAATAVATADGSFPLLSLHHEDHHQQQQHPHPHPHSHSHHTHSHQPHSHQPHPQPHPDAGAARPPQPPPASSIPAAVQLEHGSAADAATLPDSCFARPSIALSAVGVATPGIAVAEAGAPAPAPAPAPGGEGCRVDTLLTQLRQFQRGPPAPSYLTGGMERRTTTSTGGGGRGSSTGGGAMTIDLPPALLLHQQQLQQQQQSAGHAVLSVCPGVKEPFSQHPSLVSSHASALGGLSSAPTANRATWDMRSPASTLTGTPSGGVYGMGGGGGVTVHGNGSGSGGGRGVSGEHLVRRGRTHGPSGSLTGMLAAPSYDAAAAAARYGNPGVVIMLGGPAGVSSSGDDTADGTFRPIACSGAGGAVGSGGGANRGGRTRRSASTGADFPLYGARFNGSSGDGGESQGVSHASAHATRAADRAPRNHRRQPPRQPAEQNSGSPCPSSNGQASASAARLPPHAAASAAFGGTPTGASAMRASAAGVVTEAGRIVEVSSIGRTRLQGNYSADLTSRVIAHANSGGDHSGLLLPAATLTADGYVPLPTPPPPPPAPAAQLLPELPCACTTAATPTATSALASPPSPAAIALFRAITRVDPVGHSALDYLGPVSEGPATSRALRGPPYAPRLLPPHHQRHHQHRNHHRHQHHQHQHQHGLTSYHSVPTAAMAAEAERSPAAARGVRASSSQVELCSHPTKLPKISSALAAGSTSFPGPRSSLLGHSSSNNNTSSLLGHKPQHGQHRDETPNSTQGGGGGGGHHAGNLVGHVHGIGMG